MTFTIGIALIALCALSFEPLRRWLRSPARPKWLANPVNAEYLMMTHLVALAAGISLIVDALIG